MAEPIYLCESGRNACSCAAPATGSLLPGNWLPLVMFVMAACAWPLGAQTLPMKKQVESDSDAGDATRPQPKEWHDRTGRFAVKATFLDLRDGRVRLVLADSGKIIEVPLQVLSHDDQQVCRELASAITPPAAAAETPKEAPAWKRLFEARSAEIEAHIRKFDEELLRLTRSNSTTLVVEEDFVSAWADFLDSVREMSLRVHYKLKDVRREKDLPRGLTAIQLQLDEPTLECDGYSGSLKVAADPGEARKLEIGAVVQVDGQLMSPDRRSFGAVSFVRGLPSSPTYGNGLTLARAQELAHSARELLASQNMPDRNGQLQKYWTVRLIFYVDSVRVLTGKQLEEYDAFTARQSEASGGGESQKPASEDAPEQVASP